MRVLEHTCVFARHQLTVCFTAPIEVFCVVKLCLVTIKSLLRRYFKNLEIQLDHESSGLTIFKSLAKPIALGDTRASVRSKEGISVRNAKFWMTQNRLK